MSLFTPIKTVFGLAGKLFRKVGPAVRSRVQSGGAFVRRNYRWLVPAVTAGGVAIVAGTRHLLKNRSSSRDSYPQFEVERNNPMSDVESALSETVSDLSELITRGITELSTLRMLIASGVANPRVISQFSRTGVTLGQLTARCEQISSDFASASALGHCVAMTGATAVGGAVDLLSMNSIKSDVNAITFNSIQRDLETLFSNAEVVTLIPN